ncbi:MAG: zinc ABC transporter substrate-binding protein [Oscillospiraceae bacterium]
MFKSKKLVLLLLTSLAVLSFSGCKNQDKSKEISSQKPIIAVAIPPLKSFVEAVCGDNMEVITIIPPGNSPENYEPTPKEKEEFSKAKIYFSIGVPTEEANVLPNVAQKTQIIYLEKEVAKKYDDIKIGEGRDPHIWVSPKRAAVMVEVIVKEISLIDSENAKIYEENANKFLEELKSIDEEMSTILSEITNKKIIVFHPAFGYLAQDYGIEMYALEEEGKESTAKHLAEMIDFAKKENIKVIFYQAEIDSSQSKAFAEEIGGRTIMLSPLAENYIENLRLMAQTMKEAMN